MSNEQLMQMAERRRQLRLNTLQNLNNNNTYTQKQSASVAPQEKVTSDAGVLQRLGETYADVGGSVVMGAVKSLEGIYDYGAGIVGTVGGWFSDDFEEKVRDHISVNATENAFAWLDEITDDSYINEMGETGQSIVRGVAQGVGGMLPSIALTAATGGNPVVGTIAFGLGAAGQSTEEAVNQGASLGKSMLYGTAAGAVETGIEALSGFVPWDNAIIGAAKGAAKSTGKTLIKTGAKTAVGKAVSSFLSEGLEEVASDVANPALKRITGVDKEATIDVTQLPETFVIGGLTGVTMGGAGAAVNNLRYYKEGGSKFVNIAEELQSIRENEVKLSDIQNNKKKTQEQVDDFSKRVDTDNFESISNISETLKSLPSDKRVNAFKAAPVLHNIFETNGEIKADVKNNFSGVSNRNVSVGIRHQTENLNKVLKDVNARNNTKFKLDTDALNETERTTFAKVTNAVSRLAESSKYKAFAGLDVALVKTNKTANAFIKDGVIYLSREHLSSGKWVKQVIHEVTHFTEGSKEYNELASFLTEDAEAVNRAAEAIASQGYGFTADDVQYILRKAQSGEKLNAREQEAYSELISHIAEDLLGNEDSIARLTAKNKPLANRIYERIKSFIKAFRGTNADKKTVARLRKAEQLFAKALENTGKTKAELYEKQGKMLDNKLAVQYSGKRKYTPRNPAEVTRQEFYHHYWAAANKLLSDKELGILNSINFSEYEQNSDGLYMIPVGEKGVLNKIVFTDGKQDNYSINYIIEIYLNNETDLSIIRENIYDSESKGIPCETSELLEIYYSKNYDFSDFSRKSNENLRNSNGEQNGRGSSGKTQFSLKTTEYKKVKENLNEFKTIDELKEYFSEVQKEINEEARNYYPRTMQEINENERRRIEKVIEVANLEKEAIKEYRKLHSKKPKVDLNTKAQMEAIDKKYTEAISNNDIETAKYLVEQMAILKGYAVTDYQIDHKAPTNDGYNARLDDVTPMYGEDIYSTNAVRYFGTFEGFDNESIRHIQKAKGKPDKIITVYRAVPKSVKGDQIRNGDWITLTYDYAKNHGESSIIGNYRVISKKVKASEVFTDGNSIHEFGYDDGNDYYYGDTTNYRKLADVITFDDEGNPIRLRDRFNYRSDDVRFSRKETDDILSKDFTALDLEEYFDSLSLAELTELIEELEAEDPILNQNDKYVPKLSKEERRELYVSKLYEQGKLNEFVTKLVKSKPQMAKYFANTKMNNKYNPLMPSNGDEYIVMFHGTPNQFNEFDTKKVGKHGTVMGSGIYFTKSLSYAEDYKEEGGRVIATVLNIEKPLSRTSHTFTKSDLKKFIKEVVDAEGDDYLSNYGDVYRLGYDKLLNTAVDKVYDYNSNDVDIIEDIYVTSRMDFDEFHDGLTKVLGYDGIIAWNKAEGTQAVIFRSNQAKDIFNFNPTSSSDIRFSRKSFAEQVDDVLNGADTTSTHLQVRETTPQIFLDIGLENKPMLITSTHTKTAVNKKVPNKNIHALSKETLKKLPELLENPAIVMDSTKEGSIVAFVNAVDEDNNPVLCAIKINGYGFYNNIRIDSNIVTSVYGKDANPIGFIEKAVDENRVLYWDKKISQDLFSIPGLQLPDNLVSLDSNVIIHKSKYLVKSFDENSSEQFSRKYTRGEVNRIIANYTKEKAYTRKDVNRIVKQVVDELTIGGSENFAIALTKKQKSEVVESLWSVVNKYENTDEISYFKEIKKVSEYIYNNAIVFDIEALDNLQTAQETINVLKKYKNKLNLEHIKGEIKYHYDNDKSMFLKWGGGDIGVDTVPMELKSYGIYIKSDIPSEILFEIENLYNQAREIVREAKKQKLKSLSNKTVEGMDFERYVIGQLSMGIINELDESGKATDYAKTKAKTDAEIEKWKNKYLEEKAKPKKRKPREKKKKEIDPEATTQILTSIPQAQTSTIQRVKDLINNSWTNFQINFSDEQAGIIKEAKRLGIKGIEAEANYVRAAYNAAQNMLENEFNSIWDKVYKQGDEYRSEFYEYLMNYHNIDRLAVGKELLANTTPADSRKNIVALETKHPEFKELAKDVWKYTKKLQQLRVEMGLITQEQADYMNAMYPHYVPAFRADTGGQGVAGASGKYSIKVKSTIKTAKGSTSDILPPDVFIARQTMEVFRAGRVNMLAKKFYDGVVNSKDFTNVSVADIKQRWQPNRTNKQLKFDRAKANEILELMDDDYIAKEKKQNQITFYDGAKTITIAVTPDIYAGFDAFSPDTEYRNALLNIVTGANNTFKKLVTSANPFFLVRNFFRDLQEAAFYTKHGVKFAPALMRAYKGILQNSDMWQKYLEAGGLSTGLFDYNTGVKRYKGIKAAANFAIGKLEWANMFIEQAPRFAEFMLSMEKGETIQQALLDSAEVTTNFSRGGKFAKFLNRTVMPFLNPSIQGWSKLCRTVFGKKAMSEWLALIFKALLLGITATALNDLMNGDDEEYESLNLRDKENYYLFKIGDTFLKIPKGRVLSVFGSLYLRGKEMVKGNENAWDGYLSSVASAVSPVDSLTRTLFSPLTDAATNTTWYGGQIEGRKFENVAPEERYDESTSSIAIFLGKTFNYSPKKIHYVIDQYSGIIGDLLLPATTKKAERGILASNFTIDPALSNRYSNEFYTALDEATYAKNAGDINATYIARYLNSVAGEVSDMYAEKQKIEKSDKSKADKSAEVKTIQALINNTNKSAVEQVKTLETTLNSLNVVAQNNALQQNKKFLKLDEQSQKRAIQKLNDYYYALAMNKAFGTELEAKYEKYAEFNSPDLFVYLTEISAIESDKDRQGNAISGSRKAKIIKYLQSKNVTGTKQEIILEILGYSTKN